LDASQERADNTSFEGYGGAIGWLRRALSKKEDLPEKEFLGAA